MTMNVQKNEMGMMLMKQNASKKKIVILVAIFTLCLALLGNVKSLEVKLENNISKVEPTNEANMYAQKFYKADVWNAGISEKNLVTENDEILLNESSIGAVDEEIPAATVPLGKYESESFTVYDLNSGRNVTQNGFDMICQIVRNEVGSYYSKTGETVFEKETIKAFAVAAYSHLKYCKQKGITTNVGLKTDVPNSVIEGVLEVDGQGIYFNSAIICATYTASTAGTTISSVNSWGYEHPYLISVQSKYDYLDPYYGKVTTFTEKEVKKLIEKNTDIKLSNNPNNWFQITSIVEGKYVDTISIDGHSSCITSGKSINITGTIFRNKIMGTDTLLSTAFTVEYNNGLFYFTTYGYGHGTGLSAYGANLYAENDGWDYTQILQHYFSGITIE